MSPPRVPVKFSATALSSPITQIAIPIVAATGPHDVYPGGSAVIVGPRIALTARHVVEEFYNRFADVSPWDARGEMPFAIQAMQIVPGIAEPVMWHIVDVWMAEPIDIAVLSLEPMRPLPAGFVWNLPRLQLLPPLVGSRVSGFGYPNSQVFEPEATGMARVRPFPTTTVGEVITIHHRYRDRANLPFPCFQTNARFDGGMSGGPVFNSTGQLCGIICSNIAPYTDAEDHISYVSTLWPAMAIHVNSPLLHGTPDGPYYRLIDLARAGYMNAVDIDSVRMPRPDEPQDEVYVQYDTSAYDRAGGGSR